MLAARVVQSLARRCAWGAGCRASDIIGTAGTGSVLASAPPPPLRWLSTPGGPPEPIEGSVRVNGVQLHYTVSGGPAGLPPIVALPGALGTAETDFGPQLRGLANSLTVVSFDPRGYGRSRPPERNFPHGFYQRDADDAAALMQALGHKEYAVMGWSDGAMSAVLLAASFPAKVDRLLIFGGNAYLSAADIDAFEATRDVATSWSPRMRDTHVPVYGEEGLQRLWTCAVDAWGDIYENHDGKVCAEEAKTITCPTLVMHGAKDPICLSEHPEWFHANIPGATGIPIFISAEGKHNFHLRYADEVNEAIRNFCTVA